MGLRERSQVHQIDVPLCWARTMGTGQAIRHDGRFISFYSIEEKRMVRFHFHATKKKSKTTQWIKPRNVML